MELLRNFIFLAQLNFLKEKNFFYEFDVYFPFSIYLIFGALKYKLSIDALTLGYLNRQKVQLADICFC